MDVSGIGSPRPADAAVPSASGKAAAADGSFAQTLQTELSRVDALQQSADHAIAELAAGQSPDLHQTMIAIEKADLSFQLMMQVRNKLVAAYEEITRMQI